MTDDSRSNLSGAVDRNDIVAELRAPFPEEWGTTEDLEAVYDLHRRAAAEIERLRAPDSHTKSDGTRDGPGSEAMGGAKAALSVGLNAQSEFVDGAGTHKADTARIGSSDPPSIITQEARSDSERPTR